MGKYPRSCVKPVSQYSHEYHLSRKVECVDCCVPLHKNHDFVLHGFRCSRCWDEYVRLCNRSSVLADYTVYVWLTVGSVEAEVVRQVSASSVNKALELVMVEEGMDYAFHVWVVAEKVEDDEERFEVELSVLQVG